MLLPRRSLLLLIMLAATPALLFAQAEEDSVPELTNEKIWYSVEFFGSRVQVGASMQDGIHYSMITRDTSGNKVLAKYKYKTGEQVETLLNARSLVVNGDSDLVRLDAYHFGPQEDRILIASEQEKIYRRSRKAFYYLYDLATETLTPLADTAKGKQRMADFSPDGSKIAFVRNNNIFYKDLKSGKEVPVTRDGEMNKIINGATDWVYEEEFAFTKAFHWSPDGDKIAFIRFDEAHVKEFLMKYYRGLYPDQYRFKYPKAGEENAHVSVHIHDLESRKTRPCAIGDPEYIPRIQWTPDNDQLCIMRMNRHQNQLEFLFTQGKDKNKDEKIDTEVVYTETSDTYIEITDDLTFLENGQGFIWTNETDGYNHIYHYDMQGELVQQVTQGEWVVTELEGVDEEAGKVYYTSAEASPRERHIYSIGLDGKDQQKLTPQPGTHDATFSTGFRYFIDHHSEANTPETIRLYDAEGKLIKVLEDNGALKETLDQYQLPQKEFFTFENREGTKLNGWMIKPTDFDPSREYPVLLHVYGGPGINTVNDRWGGRNFMWHRLLAQEGYIVVSVDPRGTGYRGTAFKNCTYQQLGKLETQDCIDAAQYLSEQDYIDPERIGVWGWSYGGYLTSLCMTVGHEFFDMGMAVAPVTNWRFYDTIYTERFMRTPQENPDGYDDNSPINHVEKLDAPYLIVHGAADDNVHLQNTLMMVDELVKANKPFEQFIYPNKDHGIYGGTTRLHLFSKMTRFVKGNL